MSGVTPSGIPFVQPADALTDFPALSATLATLLEGRTGAGLIADQLRASTGALDFAAIPATFRHLLLVGAVRSDDAATWSRGKWALNADTTAANYLSIALDGSNSAAVAIGQAAQADQPPLCGAGAPAGHFSPLLAFFPLYGDAVSHAQILSWSAVNISSVSFVMRLAATRWNNAAAVNRIQLLPGAGTGWVAGSRLSLYGLY